MGNIIDLDEDEIKYEVGEDGRSSERDRADARLSKSVKTYLKPRVKGVHSLQVDDKRHSIKPERVSSLVRDPSGRSGYIPSKRSLTTGSDVGLWEWLATELYGPNAVGCILETMRTLRIPLTQENIGGLYRALCKPDFKALGLTNAYGEINLTDLPEGMLQNVLSKLKTADIFSLCFSPKNINSRVCKNLGSAKKYIKPIDPKEAPIWMKGYCKGIIKKGTPVITFFDLNSAIIYPKPRCKISPPSKNSRSFIAFPGVFEAYTKLGGNWKYYVIRIIDEDLYYLEVKSEEVGKLISEFYKYHPEYPFEYLPYREYLYTYAISNYGSFIDIQKDIDPNSVFKDGNILKTKYDLFDGCVLNILNSASTSQTSETSGHMSEVSGFSKSITEVHYISPHFRELTSMDVFSAVPSQTIRKLAESTTPYPGNISELYSYIASRADYVVRDSDSGIISLPIEDPNTAVKVNEERTTLVYLYIKDLIDRDEYTKRERFYRYVANYAEYKKGKTGYLI